MYCPGCHKKLDTSLTSCDRCGSLQLGLGQSIPRAEHDRIVAEKDAEIARLHDKLCVVKMVIETLRARQDTVRNNALEDAARMVDCACECRDAVLAAKTKVDRWNACGRDPCGALDAADIRALKGGEE